MIKNLIWDFDGTLYDTYAVMLDALQQTAQDFEITELTNVDLYRMMKLKSVRFVTDYVQRIYGVDQTAFSTTYHRYEHAQQIQPRPYPGAAEILTLIVQRGGLNLLDTHRDQQAQEFLQHDNLAQYFIGGITASDDFPRKPDPSAILALLQRYQLNPEETAMVGDRRLDILAGVNAKIATIYFNVDHLYDAPQATWSINRLTDIRYILSETN